MTTTTDRPQLRELVHRVSLETPASVRRASLLGDDYRYTGNVRPLYEAMLEVARVAGCPVTRTGTRFPGMPASAGGWFKANLLTGEPHSIGIITDAPLEVQARRLLHEEGHLFTPGIVHYSRGQSEIIAESAAFIVGRQLGFVDGYWSPAYVASWTYEDDVLNGDAPVVKPELVTELEVPILTTAAILGDAVDREYSFAREVAA